jgi:hypothetical protein
MPKRNTCRRGLERNPHWDQPFLEISSAARREVSTLWVESRPSLRVRSLSSNRVRSRPSMLLYSAFAGHAGFGVGFTGLPLQNFMRSNVSHGTADTILTCTSPPIAAAQCSETRRLCASPHFLAIESRNAHTLFVILARTACEIPCPRRAMRPITSLL